MTTYRRLTASEIDRALFAGFVRRQEVTRCWRKINGAWQIRDIAFVDDWSEEDYAFLVTCLQNTVCTGGAVFGAFADGVLKGFVSVESAPLGRNGDYRDLSSLHVSQELRGQEIGRRLFALAREFAREQGALKLYISAHSAVETQAFYRAMGCTEAQEYDPEHVEREPCDCQLECRV
mgnify:FL=1